MRAIPKSSFSWLIACALALGSPHTLAAFLEGLQDAKNTESDSSFLVPNEQYPQQAKVLLEDSIPGVYASVGTERGFISASMAEQATHLLLFDYDPNVAKYNRINTALLELASNRVEYLNLRLKSTHASWDKLVKSNPSLSAETRAFLNNPDNWKWWNQNVRKEARFQDFHSNGGRSFQGVNYLFEDAPFEKLSRMAKEGKIQSVVGDLGNENFTKQIAESIKKAGLHLSVLDVSNAWWNAYTPTQGLESALKNFGSVASDRTRFLFTDGSAYHWNYFSLDFEHLRNPKAAVIALRTTESPRHEGYPAIHNLPLYLKRIKALGCEIFASPSTNP